MKIIKALLFTALTLTGYDVYSQAFNITGRIIDANDTSALSGVPVSIAPANDTGNKSGTVTDFNGNFILPNVQPGAYLIAANYIGYKPFTRTVTVVNGDMGLGTIKFEVLSTQLKTVNVAGKQTRAQQLGDTTQFNSAAFKTNPDANAEDLITKMPGITSDNTGVKVNGETVKQVLVDGKPFFGDDPNAALKNLPAEIIDKIQVFDKMSDQSQFTGFDDGSSSKSINIITKKGRNAGQFGKVYAGYGAGQDANTKDRYQAGGNINFFKGDRRISLIGMSNNINQQNFSTEDITGSVGASSGNNRGGGYRGGGGGYRGGGGSDFLVGQQGGITNTNSLGLNYSDKWGKKIDVSGSYFFNSSKTSNISEINREYYNSNIGTLLYNEKDTLTSNNTNHRLNFRFEYNIDSNNSIILSPRLSVQDFHSTSDVLGGNSLLLPSDNGSGSPVSFINNHNESNSLGYNFSNNLLYRHKFKKERRTLSLNVNTSINNKTGDGSTNSFNEFYDTTTTTTLLSLKNENTSNSYTLGGNISYTEPIGKKGQVSVSYNPSFTNNMADKNTDSLVPNTDQTYIHDSLLSNQIENTYTTHRGELSYRIGDRKLNFSVGVAGQYAVLEGLQSEPYTFAINKDFKNVLPNAMFNYRFSQSSNLRIFYRTSTNAPSISQLQDVVDISNPILLRSGNPDLKQSYNHMLMFRYGNTNTKTANSFFFFANGNYTNDYIATETIIPTSDTTFNGVDVNRGSQISRPVNLSGYFSGRTFATYGLPVDLIKSNLNLNAGFTYTHAPSLLNGRSNFSNSSTITGGAVVSSNISENLDFTLSYNANYNTVRNTLQTQSNTNYFNHIAGAKVNWIFYKRFVLNTSIYQNFFSGLSDATFNQTFLQWNAYFAYKLLKNNALELRLSAFDILNQNKSITRNTTETYFEDVRTQVLTQYFMLTATYTLRNFNSGAAQPAETEGNRERFRPDGPGGFRHGGGGPPPGGMN